MGKDRLRLHRGVDGRVCESDSDRTRQGRRGPALCRGQEGEGPEGQGRGQGMTTARRRGRPARDTRGAPTGDATDGLHYPYRPPLPEPAFGLAVGAPVGWLFAYLSAESWARFGGEGSLFLGTLSA